jgi:Domain of unknown function (DUF4382)
MQISSRYSVLRTGLTACVIAMLVACGGGDGGGPAGSGKVSLGITDAPVDSAQHVVVQFSGVAFKREGETAETMTQLNPSPQSVDLLEYQGGKAAVLIQNVPLPAGTYEWVRLLVNADPNVRDSYLVDSSGAECELRIPSGAETGLKLNRGFTLPADGSVALTVDFDLRQSVHAPPGLSSSGACTQAYLLRPTLRLVDDADVGAIAGTVNAALVPTGCVPVVYVFAGSNVIPDDYETSSSSSSASSGSSSSAVVDVDALTTAKVEVVNGLTAYGFKSAFLPVGAYTVSFTCTADDMDADETLTFVQTQNVTVQRNLITSVDFVAPTP